MSNSNSPLDIVQGISLYDLKSFLRSKGWLEISCTNRKLSVFQGPEGDSGNPLEVFLPSSNDFEDLTKRIYDVFSLLSNLYEIEPAALSRILKSLNIDKFFVKISPDDNFPFSIPLEVAKKEVNGLRNLFVYSACSEKKALPHHETPSRTGYNMAKKIRFGHTFHGSFGFSVESPVVEEFKQQDMFFPPIERRIIERIIRGIQKTNEAISKQDPDILASGYQYGFNSRMCEAIVEMGEELETPLELAVHWASSLPPSEDVSNFKVQAFGDEEFSYLKYAANKMKEVDPENSLILGKVVNLRSNDPTSESGKRIIILKHHHENYGNINVKIELGVNQYLLAIEAHKSRAQLEVQGILERKGSSWQLEAVSDLKIINE
ncbi:MAG: hypothetical protein ACL93V_00345 [Candidatus Electrothrix sp. YB6]